MQFLQLNTTYYFCTRIHDVGEVELEVVAGAVAHVDGAAGAEARGAGAKDGAAPGVALRPAETHALHSSA